MQLADVFVSKSLFTPCYFYSALGVWTQRLVTIPLNSSNILKGDIHAHRLGDLFKLLISADPKFLAFFIPLSLLIF